MKIFNKKRGKLAVLALGLTANIGWAAPIVTVGNGSTYGSSLLNNTATDPNYPDTHYYRYQQVYGAAAFLNQGVSGPVAINSLTFFAASEICFFVDCFAIAERDRSIAAGNYTIRLSTTRAGVDGLAATFDTNWGADVQTFFDGDFAGNSLTFMGSTFLYDPSMGNLLLDIMVNSQTANFGYLLRDMESLAQFNGGQRDQLSSRIGTNITSATTTGVPWTRSGGYKTEFGYSEALTVPEPTTWVLLSLGLLAMGVASVGSAAAATRSARLPLP